MKKIMLSLFFCLIFILTLQAQNVNWKEQLNKVMETTRMDSLTLLGYTYLGEVKTKEEFGKLKKQLLGKESHIPTYENNRMTIVKLGEISDTTLVKKYREYISYYLEHIFQFKLGVVELRWKFGGKTFLTNCIVTERSVVYDSILGNLFTFEKKEKMTITSM